MIFNGSMIMMSPTEAAAPAAMLNCTASRASLSASSSLPRLLIFAMIGTRAEETETERMMPIWTKGCPRSNTPFIALAASKSVPFASRDGKI